MTKIDKVNKWSQGIHSVTPHIELEYIKGKENVLVDSLSRLKHLGLSDNDPEESGQEYSKSIFDMDENTVNSIESDKKNINNKFEIDGIKYSLDEKDLGNTRLQNTGTNATGTNSLPCICYLGSENIKWLQQKDECVTKLIDMCKATKNEKISHFFG